MIRKIGFLTIGQSPREDVLEEIVPLLGPDKIIKEAGALDSLSRSEIEALRPTGSDFPLITRLRDGASVVVGKKKIVPLIRSRVECLEREGVDLVALLCTEDFDDLSATKPLLMPARIMRNFVFAVLTKGRLFVLVPLSSQKKAAKRKWKTQKISVNSETLNPYGGGDGLEAVLPAIEEASPDIIIPDCIGYPLEIKERLRKRINRPVLLPRLVLAAAISELA
ncbi:MAG: AroM family protein [Clostridiales bacterium]|nr:AroM family protein [Clostridiales bacterium]